jgi:hypothetical protein
VYAPETEEQKLELSLTLWNPRAKAGAFAYALETEEQKLELSLTLWESKSKSWSFRLRSGNPTRTLSPALAVEATS